MRFPWLQVDADFIAAHAGDLGAHLGIGRREAIGLAVDLWTWALARAPDDAPPDGVITGTGTVPARLLAGAVGWTGPEATLTDALVACGLAVRIDDGYRLTGFSRYKATWEKNRRRPGDRPDRNRTGTAAKPERKTQTQTQKDEDLSASRSAGAEAPREDAPTRPPLVLEPSPSDAPPEEPKKRERRLSAAEELYAAIQRARRIRCEDTAEPFVEDRWDNARQNKLLGPVAKGSAEERKRFEGAFGEFLADEQWKPKGWPLSLFMSGAVRSRYEKQALDAEKGAA